MHLQRTTAALFGRAVHDTPVHGQNPHGCGVRIAKQLRHDAAFDEAHSVTDWPPRRGDVRRGPATNTTLRRPEHSFHFAHSGWQQTQRAGSAYQALQTSALVHPQTHAGGVKQPGAGEDRAQDGSADRLLGRVDRFGDCSRGLDDGAVLDSRRARCLTRAAVQAGVDVLAKIRIVWTDFAFVDLADLVDATAR